MGKKKKKLKDPTKFKDKRQGFVGFIPPEKKSPPNIRTGPAAGVIIERRETAT